VHLTEEQIYRYSRHIVLPEVGGEGQKNLLKSKVFCVGAGGLGSPIALYLVAAGVGTLGIADCDDVDISNLQRQVLHHTGDIGKPKTESAREKLEELNPDVNIVLHNGLIKKDNVRELIRDYDIVVDGSDNFPTRYLVNDGCYFEKKTLVSGAIFQFEGHVAVFKPHTGGPCYRCLYPELPPEGLVPSCQEAGILGAAAGTVGTIQALETLKQILSIGDPLTDRLLVFNALKMSFNSVNLKKDPECPLCGKNPSIHGVEEFSQAACDVTASPIS
jgi:molybdopterin/thiamine biosynthesis adenylyltransferase